MLQGHQDEVWGLACHPGQRQFVTTSSDGRINVWDALTHSVMWGFDLPVTTFISAAQFIYILQVYGVKMNSTCPSFIFNSVSRINTNTEYLSILCQQCTVSVLVMFPQ